MTRLLSVALDDATATALDLAAGRVGQSPEAFLADQLAVALGPGRNLTARSDTPHKISRSARKRIAAAKRAARDAAREAATTEPETTTTDD